MPRVLALGVLVVAVLLAHGDQEPGRSTSTELRGPAVSLIDRLTARLDDLQAQLTEQSSVLEELKRESRGRPQVAFSASISTPPQENLGPFANETKLVFNKVLTNIGDAYSPDTGVFTAPVKGVYYFRYTGYSRAMKPSGLSIFHADRRVVSTYKYSNQASYDNGHSSNGVTLLLAAGDTVHMQLWVDSWVFVDSRYNYCSFTGFLLFPM
ncbi:cerebellin 11 [Gadus macrocephalus]|uniref:cerebellin 11 n=1 Tax=Gadus macrocephalus TaxID=80720 RepID=UPI0028CB7A1C|nr:cerebellin 11 [Gadus macrocephalus]